MKRKECENIRPRSLFPVQSFLSAWEAAVAEEFSSISLWLYQAPLASAYPPVPPHPHPGFQHLSLVFPAAASALLGAGLQGRLPVHHPTPFSLLLGFFSSDYLPAGRQGTTCHFEEKKTYS